MTELVSKCGPLFGQLLQFLPLCELARLTRLSQRHRNFIIHSFTPLQITLVLGESDWWTFCYVSWGWIWLQRVVAFAKKIKFQCDKHSVEIFLEILRSANLEHLEELNLQAFEESSKQPSSAPLAIRELKCETLWILRLYNVKLEIVDCPKLEFYEERLPGHPMSVRWLLPEPIEYHLEPYRRRWKRMFEDLRNPQIRELIVSTTMMPLGGDAMFRMMAETNFLCVHNEELLCQIKSVLSKADRNIDHRISNWLPSGLRTAFYKVFEPTRRNVARILNEAIPLKVRASVANELIEVKNSEDPDLVAKRLCLEDFKFLCEWIDYPPLFYRRSCNISDFTGRCHRARIQDGLSSHEKDGYISNKITIGRLQREVVSLPFELVKERMNDVLKILSPDDIHVVTIKLETLESYSQNTSGDVARIMADMGAEWVVFEQTLTFRALKAAYRAGLLAQRVRSHQIRFLPHTLGYFGPTGSQALLGMIKGEYTEDIWLSMDLRASSTEWFRDQPRKHDRLRQPEFGSLVPRIKNLSPIPRRYAMKWAAQMLENVPIEITSQFHAVEFEKTTMTLADSWRCIEGGHWQKLQELGFHLEQIPLFRPY